MVYFPGTSRHADISNRTIMARSPASGSSSYDTPNEADSFFSGVKVESTSTRGSQLGSVSSPKIRQLFNIFHPSDPISYRLEPLISPAMTTLKPQSLPYTKKGLLNAANQGLTGIGAKVGQSVSGLWSSLSAGIASNMLNRSLGLSNEEVARMADQVHTESEKHGSAARRGDESPGQLIDDESERGEKTNERKKQLADAATSREASNTSGNDPTLIDDELETLFAQFQRERGDASRGNNDAFETGGETRKARKMRSEENKVRFLNRNGRVDYTIQE